MERSAGNLAIRLRTRSSASATDADEPAAAQLTRSSSALPGGGEEDELYEPPFAPQTLETVLQAAHQTSGVDLHVSPERLLLLATSNAIANVKRSSSA